LKFSALGWSLVKMDITRKNNNNMQKLASAIQLVRFNLMTHYADNVYKSPPFFLSYGTTAHTEPCPPLYWGFLITHKNTVGLLWTCDQTVGETSTYTGQHNI
jgi:hypothetical protein